MTDATAQRWLSRSKWFVGAMAAIGLLAFLASLVVQFQSKQIETSLGLFFSLLPIGFAAASLWIYVQGAARSQSYLKRYHDEQEALDGKTAEALGGIARYEQQAIENETAEPDASLPLKQTIKSRAPLLSRRLEETIRTLRRGSPLLTGDLADPEDRYFPGPERDLRAFMDIALNVGITGTFLSIMLNLTTVTRLNAGDLLAHVGPGLLSGMAAVVANVGLRLCHTAVLARQDTLADEVDAFLAYHFRLPRHITSPGERLVHAMSLQIKAMSESQSGALDRLNETAENLTRYIKHLAYYSQQWEQSVAKLKEAQGQFVAGQNHALEQHQQQIDGLLENHRSAMEQIDRRSAETLRQSVAEMHQFTLVLQQKQTELLKGVLESLHEQFAALVQNQAEANQRLTDEALQRYGNALVGRVEQIESHVAQAMDQFRERLPAVLHQSLSEALQEAQVLVDLVREEAGRLAHQVDQVGQGLDRPIQQLEAWSEQAIVWMRTVEQSSERERQSRQEAAEKTSLASSQLTAAAGTFTRSIDAAADRITLLLTDQAMTHTLRAEPTTNGSAAPETVQSLEQHGAGRQG